MTQRFRLTVIAALVLAAAFVSCGGDDSSSSAGSGGGGGGSSDGADATIVTQDNSFAPAKLKVPPGEVTVEVTNEGSSQHTFTSEELGFDTGTLASSDTATVTFTAPSKPTRFVCLLHESSGMTGEVVPE